MGSLQYRWEWRLPASPEELWPLASNTNRFNRDTGLPTVERDGGRPLRFRRGGIAVEWEEEPFEWVRPVRFGVARRYLRGPLEQMRVQVVLAPDGDGTLLTYDVDVTSRGALGRLAARIEIGWRSRRRFERVFREYADAAAHARPLASAPAALVPGGRERLAAAGEELARRVDPALAARLVDRIEHGDEFELAQLRPYALADEWGVARRAVLDACLYAVRAGLLTFRWSVMCPRCRGPAEQREALADLRLRAVHCDSCNIEFGPDFDQAVELRFRPSPSVRQIGDHDYCVGGPQVTPHIVAQQLLEPGERRQVEVRLEPGRYRLRAARGSRFVTVVDGAGELVDAAGTVGTDATLTFEQDGDERAPVVLERVAWTDQAVTAAEVTSRQLFRDLFAREALRPGEELSVGFVVMLFTDLRDSTRFYRRVGDAPAFGAVMSHFDVLRRAVAEEDGATVKTMGDAVMAVFDRPANAIRAVLRAQHELAEPLVLKAGVHMGPCMAVTQNDRLDYFGSTVNVAARLVGLSSGGDLVVSDEVLADPEVAELRTSLSVTPVDARLKGFEDTAFALWRLAPLQSPKSKSYSNGTMRSYGRNASGR